MSNLSNEQVEELGMLINRRFAEFVEPGSPHFMFAPMSRGLVRLVYGIVEEWQCANPLPVVELSSPGIGQVDVMDGYHIGWDRGREALRQELAEAQAAKELSATPVLSQAQREALAASLGKFLVKPTPTDSDQIRADIREHTAYPSLEPEPNGADIFADVHPVAGGPEPVYTGLAVDKDTAPHDQDWAVTHADGRVDIVSGGGALLESTPALAPPPLPEPVATPVVTNGNGHHVTPSPAAVATLGPEHTVVTPIVPRRPRTLAEVDAGATKATPASSPEKETVAEEIKTMRMDATQRATQLREIVGCLQDMAEGNEMPSMATWNEKKPAHLPKADTLLHRYSLNWAELARYCHLDFQGKRGPKPMRNHPLHRVSA